MLTRLKEDKFIAKLKLKQAALVAMGTIMSAASFSPVALAEQIGSGDTGNHTGIKYMRSGWVYVYAGKTSTFTFHCPSGNDPFAISGSIETRPVPGNLFKGYVLIDSRPTSNFKGWQIRFRNTDDIRRDFRIHTTCLD